VQQGGNQQIIADIIRVKLSNTLRNHSRRKWRYRGFAECPQ
jgi:hypothetical protein